MVISHNLPAENARNKLAVNVTGMKKASEKLSSGFRINRAADDAAGLAVSEKMRSQIRGLKQSVRNAQDGISYIQTAEGALNSMHDILRRCKEIAVEAANGTYDNATDRASVQLEFNQLRDELDHEAMTDFNGKYVFDTTGATPPDAFGNAVRELAGDNPSELSDTFVKITLGGGIVVPITITCDSLTDGNAEFKNAITLSEVANKIGVSQNAVRSFAETIRDDYLPKLLGGIVGALPKSSVPTTSGMTIGFNFYSEDSNELANVTSNGMKFQLNININHLNPGTGGTVEIEDDFIGTVAHEMTHAVMFDTLSRGMLGIDKDGGQHLDDDNYQFPHWFTEGMAETVGGGVSRLYDIMGKNNLADTGGVSSKVNKEVTIAEIQSYMGDIKSYNPENSTEALIGYSRGYAACMYLGYLAGGGKDVTKDVTSDVISKGLDVILTSVASGYSLDETIAHYTSCDGIDDFIDKIDGEEPAKFVNALITNSKVQLGLEPIPGSDKSKVIFKGGAGSIISPNGLSGGEKTFLNGGSSNDFFKLDLDKTWGSEEIFNDLITKDPNRVYEGGNTKGDPIKDRGGKTPEDFPDGPDPNDPDDPDDPGGTDKPGSWGVSHETLILQVGARSNGSVAFTFRYKSDALGSLKSDLCCTAKGLGLNKLSLANQKSANKAIDSIDHAINKVSLIRATFGSVSNRLEHKVINLTSTDENLTQAESIIRDTDMASEMMNYTKFNILQQASQSMLAQVNQLPQGILSLIGG